MKIVNYDGNLLDSTADIICHQCNCQGKMNSGVAKAIREQWPFVYYQYMQWYNRGKVKLGEIQVVGTGEGHMVANLFAQDHYGYDGKQYTSYEALQSCLNKLRDFCIEQKAISIAFPWHMSCDRGGADWSVVSKMIEDTFADTDLTIEIWKLNK